jgi:hypothetical protein
MPDDTIYTHCFYFVMHAMQIDLQSTVVVAFRLIVRYGCLRCSGW